MTVGAGIDWPPPMEFVFAFSTASAALLALVARTPYPTERLSRYPETLSVTALPAFKTPLNSCVAPAASPRRSRYGSRKTFFALDASQESVPEKASTILESSFWRVVRTLSSKMLSSELKSPLNFFMTLTMPPSTRDTVSPSNSNEAMIPFSISSPIASHIPDRKLCNPETSSLMLENISAPEPDVKYSETVSHFDIMAVVAAAKAPTPKTTGQLI